MAPFRQRTSSGTINRDRRACLGTLAALVLILSAACSDDDSATEAATSSTVSTPGDGSAASSTASTTSPPALLDCTDADVTEAAAGQQVQVGTVTSRFAICLDEAKHPLRELTVDGCPFGYVSNYSLNGPGNYPIGFEVTRSGSCTVRNGDYQVRVVASG
jgi:hypothetical protein